MYCIWPKIGTWKSAVSVLPFSALVPVCVYHTSEKNAFSLENGGILQRFLIMRCDTFIFNMVLYFQHLQTL